MKKIFGIVAAFAFAYLVGISCKGKADTDEQASKYEVLTYVWSGGKIMPDLDLITSINYAFGRVSDDRKSVRIENEDRLREVVALKKQKPELKVLLSLGGGCSEGFSELAASDSLRKAFAADCRRVIDEFGLDGIDYDWEAPGFDDGTPEDVDNFELLLAETRKAIGDDKLLTVASMAGALGMNLPEILAYVDYFNVMCYDMTWTDLGSHTSMRESPVAGDYTVERAMKTYEEKGVPKDKIMLGLAFYGRGDDKNFKGWTDYRDIDVKPSMEVRWDSIGCVPYVVDSLGSFILGYENPRSLEIKCDYIKDLGLRGAMCWRTELDNDSLELAHTVARSLLGDKK